MKTILLFSLILLGSLFTGCDIIEDVIDIENGTGAGTLYYWITTDADTYVECTFSGGGCSGGDFDHSGYDFITVANSQLSLKRAYVNFPGVQFPQGTVIEEAYFELYHSGKNEDGKTDDLQLDVNRVRTAWNAGTITYFNQPIQPGHGGEFQLKLESQNWSGTNNMAGAMQQDLGSPNFQGFLITYHNAVPGIEKGFHSGNHRSRTLNDLGLAPRLLLKVTLPSGFDSDDVLIGPGHGDGSGGNYIG
jgi:hypothetical protein